MEIIEHSHGIDFYLDKKLWIRKSRILKAYFYYPYDPQASYVYNKIEQLFENLKTPEEKMILCWNLDLFIFDNKNIRK